MLQFRRRLEVLNELIDLVGQRHEKPFQTWRDEVITLLKHFVRPGLINSSVKKWLSQEVFKSIAPVKLKASVPLTRRICTPGWTSSVLLLLLLLGLWGISHCITPEIKLPEEKTAQDTLRSHFGTMWQVQAALASVALPLLLFLIELAKDDKQAALPTHEVLIRDSWILPILLFSLMGTIRIGIDASWYCCMRVLAFDLFVILGGAILLTTIAYIRILLLLFRPSTLQKRAVKVANERMSGSLENSLYQRAARRVLESSLAPLGVEVNPYMFSRRNSSKYLSLTISAEGVLTDLHLARIERFVNALPRPAVANPGPVGTIQVGAGSVQGLGLSAQQTSIYLLKNIGDRITPNTPVLIIEKSEFGFLKQSILEKRLRDILKVEKIDEA